MSIRSDILKGLKNGVAYSFNAADFVSTTIRASSHPADDNRILNIVNSVSLAASILPSGKGNSANFPLAAQRYLTSAVNGNWYKLPSAATEYFALTAFLQVDTFVSTGYLYSVDFQVLVSYTSLGRPDLVIVMSAGTTGGNISYTIAPAGTVVAGLNKICLRVECTTDGTTNTTTAKMRINNWNMPTQTRTGTGTAGLPASTGTPATALLHIGAYPGSPTGDRINGKIQNYYIYRSNSVPFSDAMVDEMFTGISFKELIASANPFWKLNLTSGGV